MVAKTQALRDKHAVTTAEVAVRKAERALAAARRHLRDVVLAGAPVVEGGVIRDNITGTLFRVAITTVEFGRLRLRVNKKKADGTWGRQILTPPYDWTVISSGRDK